MGVSWRHEVYFICRDDESSYLESLPERLPGPHHDVPVVESSYDNDIIHLSSGGYNIFDIFGPDFPRPESWIGVVHRISPCQGQDFDIVDWIDRTEFDDKYDDLEGEDEGFNPMDEYTDPGSEYWEINEELNVLSETPDFDDEDDDWEDHYDDWMTKINTQQEMDIKKGIEHFISQI